MAKRILHLEDWTDHGKWIDDYLRSEGYEVVPATSPVDARAALNASKARTGPTIDGILADLKMKDPSSATPNVESMDVGIWFLYELRQDPAFKDLPIVILSGHTEDSRIPGIQFLLRIRAVLQKPVTNKLLSKGINDGFGPP